ncbi:MAG: hypothetical protein A2350_13710 [Candidatus Raymondbacteria bacterium RifOxyB12_full_50_8]|nr:MAG: hypothetical protein A2350_13710 [Candidatus Raymondbacteria bacterium RifOxyB12_full_50_8]
MLAENPLDWNCLPRDNQPDIGADEFSNNPVAIDVAAAARGGTYLSNAEPNPFQPRNSHTVRHIKNRRTQAFQHHCFGA